jgi:hypothetical protein
MKPLLVVMIKTLKVNCAVISGTTCILFQKRMGKLDSNAKRPGCFCILTKSTKELTQQNHSSKDWKKDLSKKN